MYSSSFDEVYIYFATFVECQNTDSVGVLALEYGRSFERFRIPDEYLRCLANLASGHLHSVRMKREADDVIVMAEKERLRLLLVVVHDANSSDKIDDVTGFVVE